MCVRGRIYGKLVSYNWLGLSTKFDAYCTKQQLEFQYTSYNHNHIIVDRVYQIEMRIFSRYLGTKCCAE